MNIMKILHYIIVFIVGFVCFLFIRLLVLPCLKIFIPGLGNEALTKAYDSAIEASFTVLGHIAAALLVLYLIYQVLRRIFPINLFINKIPPFRELRRSGLFGLLDALLGAFFSRGTFATRVKRFSKALGNFILSNMTMMGETTKEILHDLGVPEPKVHITLPSSKQPPAPPPQDSVQDNPAFSEEDTNNANEQYQQCLEENTTVITADMTDNEKRQASIANATLSIQCKIKAMQSLLNIFAYKV